jgi:hypothetical protein
MEVELQRQHFTRHGQHLNSTGKELVLIELANEIDQLLINLETNTIQTQWNKVNLQEENLPAQDGVSEPTATKKL